MITGFEDHTAQLNEYELKHLVPFFIKGIWKKWNADLSA